VKKRMNFSSPLMAALLLGTSLSIATPASAQVATTPVGGGIIKTINVTGSQRLEADTVRSYIRLRAGTPYTTVICLRPNSLPMCKSATMQAI
jgi:outer membrane protein assembly factor BamA